MNTFLADVKVNVITKNEIPLSRHPESDVARCRYVTVIFALDALI